MKTDMNQFDEYTKTTLASIVAGINAHNSQMLVGNPGLGKSALVKNVADMLGYDMITIIGSQKEPQDVTGFPRLVTKPLPDGGTVSVTEYAIPYWEFEILRKKNVILFLDEFSNSTPAVQAAMLQILNEREFPDGSKLPHETVIIGAMNPVETAADGYELGLPVTNRIKFIPWEPDFNTWKRGMLTNWGHPESINKDILYWRRKVIQFLERNPSYLYRLPKKNERGAEPGTVYGFNESPAENDIYKMAYPSNRSWTNYATELAYCSNKRSLMQKAGNGLVGYEAATKFMQFLNSGSKLPTIEEALTAPSAIDWHGLDSNDVITLLNEAINYGDQAPSPQTAVAVGQLFLRAAQAGRIAEGTPLIDKVMRITRRAGDNGQLSKKVMMAYQSIGSIMNMQ